MQFRFTIARVFLGIALCALPIAFFRNTPGIGSIAGATAGTAFFVMALVAKKSDLSVILRSYIFAALGSFIAVLLSPVSTGRYHTPIGTILTGAIVGSFVAALVTLSRRSDPPRESSPSDQDQSDTT
ncbi:hypothetical protein SH528x_003456 [Novipirellula sp. SH528]|uniref:hypothetical protein n=1 Tax=Novipirellula sp. SH528 TaxID=3454466 RepID=UPI003FA13646